MESTLEKWALSWKFPCENGFGYRKLSEMVRCTQQLWSLHWTVRYGNRIEDGRAWRYSHDVKVFAHVWSCGLPLLCGAAWAKKCVFLRLASLQRVLHTELAWGTISLDISSFLWTAETCILSEFIFSTVNNSSIHELSRKCKKNFSTLNGPSF